MSRSNEQIGKFFFSGRIASIKINHGIILVDFIGIEELDIVCLTRRINGKLLLSYYDCELNKELYLDIKITSTKEINYTLRGTGSKKTVREVFITNY
jgi:hypothetical protein